MQPNFTIFVFIFEYEISQTCRIRKYFPFQNYENFVYAILNAVRWYNITIQISRCTQLVNSFNDGIPHWLTTNHQLRDSLQSSFNQHLRILRFHKSNNDNALSPVERNSLLFSVCNRRRPTFAIPIVFHVSPCPRFGANYRSFLSFEGLQSLRLDQDWFLFFNFSILSPVPSLFPLLPIYFFFLSFALISRISSSFYFLLFHSDGYPVILPRTTSFYSSLTFEFCSCSHFHLPPFSFI